jgi:peptidoglycan/xylan/chitin deacetylase (PgdA/CDA1 family)
MYHELGDARGAYPELFVDPGDFGRQIEELYEAGYRTVTLRELGEHWAGRRPLPERPVVLSFDDGYLSTFTVARPTLAEYGFVGTVFIVEQYVGRPGFMTAAMLQELAALGWEVASHTCTHPDLTRLGPDRLRAELVASRQWLEELLGSEVTSLAYPAGRHNPMVRAAALEAGYRLAVTTLTVRPGPRTGWLSAGCG